jgi:hypothetical protein
MTTTSFVKTLIRLALILSLASALAACGEGDADTPAADGSSAPPVTQPPADPTPPANQPPEITGTPVAAVQSGQNYSFTPAATDPDNDFLEFAITNKPAWATFSVDTGVLTGVPGDANVGQSPDITITVTDGRDQRAVGPFRITVTARTQTPSPTNKAPTITGTPMTSVDVSKPYSFKPVAADADGDKLTFAISGRPSWATFSTATGALTGTPATANIATYSNIVISVSDGTVTTKLAAFAIQVKGPNNRTPTISGTPATSVQVAQAYSFQPAGSDPDGDTLTYSIQNKPTWATFTASSGRLNGTPTATNVGSYAGIVISASDGKASVSLPSFSIAVQAAANKTPTISGTPATTGKVGSGYSFQPTSADADGDTLGYTIQNRPTWAAFDTKTGLLNGTPSAAGTFANVIISVSDSKASASLAAFSIVVSAAANGTPSISGTPATSVTAGATYNFQPTGTDPEGNTLTWNITNKPSWATFSTTTGKLSGTPAAGNAGAFANIVISVTDGTNSASLPAFTITVGSGQLGSATLSWTAPTENTDGSALSDLAGFRVVYGTSSGALNQTVQIANPGASSQVVDQLASGTWYFAVKAYTSGGAESDTSNVVSKAIP